MKNTSLKIMPPVGSVLAVASEVMDIMQFFGFNIGVIPKITFQWIFPHLILLLGMITMWIAVRMGQKAEKMCRYHENRIKTNKEVYKRVKDGVPCFMPDGKQIIIKYDIAPSAFWAYDMDAIIPNLYCEKKRKLCEQRKEGKTIVFCQECKIEFYTGELYAMQKNIGQPIIV